LWEGCDAQVGEGIESESDWDMAAQPVPDYEVDQCINWWGCQTAIQMRCGVGLRASQVQNPLASSGFIFFSIVLAATVQTAEIRGF
jgi:hypothetical protein